MSKVPSGKRTSKAGARARSIDDDLADRRATVEAFDAYKAMGLSPERAAELAVPIGAYRPPPKGQRAGVIGGLLDDAEGLLDVLDATARPDGLAPDPNDHEDAIRQGLVTVDELRALAAAPTVAVVRTARGTVPATEATEEERRLEVARSMLGALAHCGLVHASDEAVSDLARRLVRMERRDRAETLVRWALLAAGVDAKTASKWIDDAATHKAKRSSTNSP